MRDTRNGGYFSDDKTFKTTPQRGAASVVIFKTAAMTVAKWES